MSNYHVGQSFRLELETNITLTGGTCLIKYKKPDGVSKGSLSASINGSDESKMYFDITSEVDQPGKWIFWSHVVHADTTIGIGDAVEQIIKEEGEI